MKIKLLTHSCDLNKMLISKLNQMGLTTDANIVIVDHKQPLLPQVADAEIIVNGFGNIDKTIIDGCPNLQLIQQTGIGIDNVDVSYCTSKSILAVSVAEHTLFLILYLAKNMKHSADTNNNHNMLERVISTLGSEIQGKTLVIIGLGATGLEVAKRAKSFGIFSKNQEELIKRIMWIVLEDLKFFQNLFPEHTIFRCVLLLQNKQRI
jgi:D-3-phosphoglycerate dehydrogenase